MDWPFLLRALARASATEALERALSRTVTSGCTKRTSRFGINEKLSQIRRLGKNLHFVNLLSPVSYQKPE